MEKCFYDYQKNRYTIVEQYGDDYFFIKNDKSGKYYIVEKDDDFQATKKPLKSVFNKYDEKVMYDIQGIFGEGLAEAEAYGQWKDFKQEVYNVAQEQLWRDDQLKREEEAIKRGWRHINSFESTFDKNTGNLIIQDTETGRDFSVTSQEPRIDFSTFNKEDCRFYGEMWVSGYNAEFGDTNFATKNADCGMTSYWRCDELFTSTSKENRSHVFTEDVCRNIIQATLQDNPNDPFNPYINRASAELQFMEILEIPLEANSLLGDVRELGYDYLSISDRVEENMPKMIDEKKEKVKEGVNEFFIENEVPLYVTQSGVVLDRENAVLLRDGEDWKLEAIKFTDPQLGKAMYQMEAVFENDYLQRTDRMVLGTCKESDILRLQNKQNNSFIDDIAGNAVSSKSNLQNNAKNIME